MLPINPDYALELQVLPYRRSPLHTILSVVMKRAEGVSLFYLTLIDSVIHLDISFVLDFEVIVKTLLRNLG